MRFLRAVQDHTTADDLSRGYSLLTLSFLPLDPSVNVHERQRTATTFPGLSIIKQIDTSSFSWPVAVVVALFVAIISHVHNQTRPEECA